MWKVGRIAIKLVYYTNTSSSKSNADVVCYFHAPDVAEHCQCEDAPGSKLHGPKLVGPHVPEPDADSVLVVVGSLQKQDNCENRENTWLLPCHIGLCEM